MNFSKIIRCCFYMFNKFMYKMNKAFKHSKYLINNVVYKESLEDRFKNLYKEDDLHNLHRYVEIDELMKLCKSTNIDEYIELDSIYINHQDSLVKGRLILWLLIVYKKYQFIKIYSVNINFIIVCCKSNIKEVIDDKIFKIIFDNYNEDDNYHMVLFSHYCDKKDTVKGIMKYCSFTRRSTFILYKYNVEIIKELSKYIDVNQFIEIKIDCLDNNDDDILQLYQISDEKDRLNEILTEKILIDNNLHLFDLLQETGNFRLSGLINYHCNETTRETFDYLSSCENFHDFIEKNKNNIILLNLFNEDVKNYIYSII